MNKTTPTSRNNFFTFMVLRSQKRSLRPIVTHFTRVIFFSFLGMILKPLLFGFSERSNFR